MKNIIKFLMLSILVLFPLQMSFSATTLADVEEDLVTILEEEISQINNELSDIKKNVLEIKQMLTAITKRMTPKIATVSIDNDPFMGDASAPITLVEFSDYECTFCGRFAKSVLPKLKTEYINSGKVKYVFRDFPLNIHKEAHKAAEAAQCAGDQGKYWEMHNTLFANQHDLTIEKLKGHAEKLTLDMKLFNTCLDGGKYTDEVQKDLKAGQKTGMKSVPSFIIGLTTSDGIIKGRLISGAIRYEALKPLLDAMLKTPKK
jgi:protein-disulfide isomerase